MSYQIIKKVEIDKKEKAVYLTSHCNNVSPKTDSRWRCVYYDLMAKKEEWENIELDILSVFEKGSFQGSGTKYARANKILQNMPEFDKMNWRKSWDDYKKYDKTKEYWDLLKKALNTKLPKTKYLIEKTYYNGDIIFAKYRKGSRYIGWTRDKKTATKFDYQNEADRVIEAFDLKKEARIVE